MITAVYVAYGVGEFRALDYGNSEKKKIYVLSREKNYFGLVKKIIVVCAE